MVMNVTKVEVGQVISKPFLFMDVPLGEYVDELCHSLEYQMEIVYDSESHKQAGLVMVQKKMKPSDCIHHLN